MSSALTEIMNWGIAFGGLIVMLFVALNIMTKGFLLQYLKVKGSQGKLLLARIHSVTDTYYRSVKVVEGAFECKTRSKEVKRLPMADSEYSSYITRELGVSVLDSNEDFSKLYNYDFKGVAFFDNYDAGRNQSLFLRIKNRPQPLNKKEGLILGVIVITLLVVAFVAFKTMKLEEAILALGQLSGNIR